MINQDFNSILDLIKAFPDEETCIKHLEELRWNGNPISPFDPYSKVYICKGNKYKCKNTGKYFNVKTGTMFDNTKVPLQKWFLPVWLITSHKKGISSVQVSKDVGITQKTAWFMLQRIRNVFGVQADTEPMDKVVEVDETFIGGDKKNMHRNKRTKGTGMIHKTPILGMIERGGKVRAKKINKADGKTIKPILKRELSKDAILLTDGFGGYAGLGKHFKAHLTVNHVGGEYVRNGNIHTNTIEGFWSLFKRSIIGVYHYASPKHLQKYVDAMAFRYNSRTFEEGERFNVVLGNLDNTRLTYNTLINA